jgi:putative membrane protein
MKTVGLTSTSWLPFAGVAVLWIIYSLLFLRLNNRGRSWKIKRLLFFQTGILLLAAGLYPPLMQWAHHDFRGHMIQHLLIGMYAPIFLVLGAPLSLLLANLPTAISRKIMALLKSSVFRFISHPVTALLLNFGGMAVLYLTPLYLLSHYYPWLHYLIHFHFLAAGYLFAWSMVGPDPVPGRPSLKFRLVVLISGIALHAFLSKLMYAWLLPVNSLFSVSQLQQGAKLMYYWGDLSEIILLIALFAIWFKKNGSGAYRLDPLTYR